MTNFSLPKKLSVRIAAVALAALLAFVTGMVGRAAVTPPVLEHKGKERPRAQLEATVRDLLALPEAELLALVPTQTPFISAECPNCGRGYYARGLDRALWKFTLPDRLTCVNCGTTFPNDRFPLNDHETFLNTLGEKVDIAFYRDAQGRRFALPGMVQSWQNGWLLTHLEALGQLYQLTGDERYARPVVRVLERYAEVFPHYLVKVFEQYHDEGVDRARMGYRYVSTGGPWMRNGVRFADKPAEPKASEERTDTPYGWTESRWGWERWGGEMPDELVLAYDLVRGSDEFAQLSAARGTDVRARITQDLFGSAFAFLAEYPFYYHITNNASGHIADIARAGRALGRPDWVHFSYRWSRDVLEKYHFGRDGAFAESPGYLFVFLSSHGPNFAALDGYSDPPGYVGADGLHLENLGSANAKAFLKKANAAHDSIIFPTGALIPVSDSRHDDFVEPLGWPKDGRTALTRSQNVLLPGYGHALLGAGTDDRQVQAHLHFSKFTGVVHTHMDGLSLMLWAFGSEFFTDVGYHKSKYRGYATTTLSHNTVVIDRTPQHGAETKGDVLLYEPNLPGLSLVQVEDHRAYEGTATRYRRTLLLNTRDLDAPYLVDVFEVRGGRQHDYLLHGPTVFDSTADTTLMLAPVPGERPLLAAGEPWTDDIAKNPYGVFTRVRSAAADGDFAVTYRLVKPYEFPEYHLSSDRFKPTGTSFHYEVHPENYRDRLELGVRSYFPTGDTGRQAFLADSPSLIRSGLQGSELTEKLKRPSLLLRHAGAEGLTSVFVAVHEPYYGAPKITAVKRLDAGSHTSVALQIETAGRTDTVLLALEGAATVHAGAITLEGRAGLVSTPRTGPPAAYLIGGTALSAGALRVTAPTADYHGTIESFSSQWDGKPDNAFVTTAALPEGETLRGTWMFVTLGGGEATEAFEIDHIAKRAGRTWIFLRDETGLRMKDAKTTEIFFPRREFAGESHFVIYTRATTVK